MKWNLCIDTVNNEVNRIKPKYTVFESHKRYIETEDIPMNFSFNCEDFKNRLSSYQNFISRSRFDNCFNEIMQSKQKTISEMIVAQLNFRVIDKDKEISIRLSTVSIDESGKATFSVKGSDHVV